MNISFDFYTALTLAGLLQALFWALALMTKNTKANRILSLFLFLLVLGIVNFILYRTRLIFQLPHLAETAEPIFFLYPPIFYFYVRALTDRAFTFQNKHLVHLILFLAIFLAKIVFYSSSTPAKITYLQTHSDNDPLGLSFLSLVLFAQEVVYFILILTIYRRHSRHIKTLHSSIEAINLRWIRDLQIAFFCIAGLYAVQLIVFDGKDRLFIFPLALTIFIYVLGFRGMQQPQIFNVMHSSRQFGKYAKSSLTHEHAQIIIHKLQKIMDEEQLHLQHNLTLPKLAQRLSISTNHLSQVLNQQLQMSFFDYINRQRVEEAKKLLSANSDHLVIEEIAIRAGFNSKSAFNTAFKKHTGMTPSHFKNTHQSV